MMKTKMNAESEVIADKQVSLKQLAHRNFMLSLLLFIVLVVIMFMASLRDNASTNQLMNVYDHQFKVGQFKASISDVMLPINDYTMTADTKNFAKIRQAITVFNQRYEDIKSISNLTAKNHQSLDQMKSLMSEVLNIANDVADGKISSNQAPQVAVIAQNLVLSSQLKLATIVKEMEGQLKERAIEREEQATMQLYALLGFIVFIVLLLEVLNRKLVSHAQTVSKVSTDVAESASDIIEVNKMQAGIAEQQSRFMGKIIQGLELIAVSGAKIPVATGRLEKNSVVISSFAKGGSVEVTDTLDSLNHARTNIENLSDSNQSLSVSGDQVLQSLERIREVSEEANLLALNASIDGGLSITQDVQRMADQIRGYTDDIQTSMQAVFNASKQTTKSSQLSLGHVDHMVSVIQTISDLLLRIDKLSDNNGQSAALLVKAIEQQNDRNKKILQVLKHISELLHSSDNKLQAYKDASTRLIEASESLQNIT